MAKMDGYTLVSLPKQWRLVNLRIHVNNVVSHEKACPSWSDKVSALRIMQCNRNTNLDRDV